MPASPTRNSPYDVLNHKGYKFALKSADCTGATPISVFTVTGDVVLAVIGVCKDSLTTDGEITIELGVAGDTAKLILQVVDATELTVNRIWHNATPDSTIVMTTVWSEYLVSNGQDVILTTTGNVTAGTVDFYCKWYPLSADGNVVAS
jgi:hypothetical protein